MKIRQSFIANSSSCSFFIAVNKNEDAYCKFIYKNDNIKRTINLTEHFEFCNSYTEDILGVPLQNHFVIDYTPEKYNDIYNMIIKLINVFINYDFEDQRMFEEELSFNICNTDPLILNLIIELSKRYLDWISKEIDNNPNIYDNIKSYIDFITLIDSAYRNSQINDEIWNLDNYKEQNNLTEIEFYQSCIIRNELTSAFIYCQHYINQLVYLYKYNKKIQELEIAFEGGDKYDESVTESYIKNNRQFEDANFEVIMIE